MTKKIHEPIHQMKDFFKDESMRRIIPNNPYNILWVIDNYVDDKRKYFSIKEYAQECINNNKLCYITDTDLQSKLIDDKIVIERVKQLKEEHHLDIDILSCKAIRMRSVKLVKDLFDIGMNPNTVDSFNTIPPLFIAVGRKNQKIVFAYWDNEKTDRAIIDSEGNNIVHIAIKYNNWPLLRKIYIESPDLLLAKNNKSENIFDLLSDFNGGSGLFTNHDNLFYFKKLPENLKPLLLDIVHYFYVNNHSINQQNKDIHEVLKTYNYYKLYDTLDEKETYVAKRNKL